MKAEIIRAITRPIINLVFIGVTASSFYLDWVELPTWWIVMTLACGAEWVSERAVKRYKELFGGSK